MKHPVVIRVKKLQTMGNIAASAEHTWRQRDTHNADPARRHLNEDWRPVGNSEELQKAVNARVELQTVKPDAKRVLCLEYMVSAHHDAFKEGGGSVDWREYFKDALAYFEKLHGADNIVAVNIQLDERTPHLVVYAVPLVTEAGKKVKRSVIVGKNADGTQKREVREVEKKASVRLSAATFVDGSEKLSQLQTDFAEVVGKRHGLVRGVEGSQATHTTVSEYYASLKKSPAHAVIKPSALEPKVLKKGLIRNEVEGLEAIADRLTKGIQKFYEPAVQQAKTANLDRKKSAEATATLQSHQERYGAFFGWIDRVLWVASRKRILEALEGIAKDLQAEREVEIRQQAQVDQMLQHAAHNMRQADPELSWEAALWRAQDMDEDPERHAELQKWLDAGQDAGEGQDRLNMPVSDPDAAPSAGSLDGPSSR